MNRIALFRAGIALPLVLAALSGTATATDDEIVATIGEKRVKATVDASTKEVKSARVERKGQSTGDWSKEEADTETLTESLEREVVVLPASFADCNGNGLDDLVEIADGNPDLNLNLVPDSCEYGYGDLNLDGSIDDRDVFIVFGWFAAPFPIFGDLNEDGFVDASDLGIVLARWGSSPF